MLGQDSDDVFLRLPNELYNALDNQVADDQSLDIDAAMDELRIRYTQYWKIRHIPSCELGQAFKSTADSVEARNLGNQKFKDEEYDEALHFYTQSVASAPEGSEELMLAYGNRSAASFRLGELESSIIDINRALKWKHSENLEKKLLSRKEECLGELKKGGKNKKRVKLLEKETNPLRLEDADGDAKWNQLCRFGNPLLPRASSKIQLKYNDQYGRFVLALNDIAPGEILSSQKLLSWNLQPDAQYGHCSHCLSICYALISCPSCDQMYCSEQCCTEAYNLYHRTECKLLSFKVMRIMTYVDKMALRMFLIGTKQGSYLDKLMKILPIKKIFDEETDPTGKLFVNDYLSSLKMCRTFPASITKAPAWFALELVVLLQEVGFFGEDRQRSNLSASADVNINEVELFATMLLMNNVHSVTSYRFGMQIKNWDLNNYLAKGVGTAVCSLHNFINHSCVPNVLFLIRNKEHVVFATRPIAKGEQIFTSYCPPYSRKSIEERREKISNFGFTCLCEACVNNWPTHEVLFKEIVDRGLPTSDLEFLVGNPERAMEELKRTVWSVLRKKRTLQNREILSICCKYQKWLHTNLKRPFISHMECEELLTHCMFLFYDDFNRGKHLSKFRETQLSEKILLASVQHLLESFYCT